MYALQLWVRLTNHCQIGSKNQTFMLKNKIVKLGLVALGAGIALTAWQTVRPHSSRALPEHRVALCVRHQRVQVEPLLQPEVRKICECFVERIEKHMTEKEKGIVYQLVSNNNDRLVEGMSPRAINEIAGRLRSAREGCAPLMARKTPT